MHSIAASCSAISFCDFWMTFSCDEFTVGGFWSRCSVSSRDESLSSFLDAQSHEELAPILASVPLRADWGGKKRRERTMQCFSARFLKQSKKGEAWEKKRTLDLCDCHVKYSSAACTTVCFSSYTVYMALVKKIYIQSTPTVGSIWTNTCTFFHSKTIDHSICSSLSVNIGYFMLHRPRTSTGPTLIRYQAAQKE